MKFSGRDSSHAVMLVTRSFMACCIPDQGLSASECVLLMDTCVLLMDNAVRVTRVRMFDTLPVLFRTACVYQNY